MSDEFIPRTYQEPILDAIFDYGIRRLVITLPRRAGKDLTLWNAAIQQCLDKPCMVIYALPNFNSARRCIWDAIDISGKPFLDYLPHSEVVKRNEAQMKIVFRNGSVLQLAGAESHRTSFRGTNPYAVILSEYAYYEGEGTTVLDTVSPILAANGGWLAVASTPNGKNGYYHLWKLAQEFPDWWTYLKTIIETKHISPEELEKERRRMSPELFEQEYMCSFERGIDGSIFGRALNSLRYNGHITTVAYHPNLLVHVSIDIGLSRGNATTLIWFQVIGDGQIINIIDCYSSENLGLDFYAALLQEKAQKYGYKYGVYLAPHDLAVREWGAGAVTRYEKARQLDIDFTILPQTLLADQIENTLTHFPKVWIDEVKCKALIDALENYYREWDEQKQVYKRIPVHNWASNYASAFMGLFLGLHHTQTKTSAEQYDRIRQDALYGDKYSGLPKIFRDGMRGIQE